jgi:hypothetical protein
MGQANAGAQIDGWKAAVSPTEEAAQHLLERFIEPDEATGMCHRALPVAHLLPEVQFVLEAAVHWLATLAPAKSP